MTNNLIYTDICNPGLEDCIRTELGLYVVRQISEDQWNIQDSSRILTDPSIAMCVISRISEISLMEIGLLLFLCKPILIADPRIYEYEILSKQVDYIDSACNLKEQTSNFISWYKYMEQQWKK